MAVEHVSRLRGFDSGAFREAWDTWRMKSNVMFDDDSAQVLNLAFTGVSGECR